MMSSILNYYWSADPAFAAMAGAADPAKNNYFSAIIPKQDQLRFYIGFLSFCNYL